MTYDEEYEDKLAQELERTHHKRIYAKPDDPHRCQAINKRGEQCLYKAMPGSTFCIGHNRGVRKQEMSNYLLTKIRGDVDRHANNKQVFNLREDLGIIRLLLEKRLNSCDNDMELMMQAPAIADLVDRVQKLVHSSVKLEERLRNLLDINAVNLFAETVTKAVIDEIDALNLDQERRDAILDRIADKIEKAMPKYDS